MNNLSSLALRLFAALAVPALPALRAAERAPALASLTYSGDQSALEALDRELVAAGKDTAKLTALRGSLLAVLRHRDASYAGKQAAAQRLGLVLAALPPAERAADYRPLSALLEDPLNCDVARLALDPAPGAVVDQMFTAALDKVSGAHRVSLLTSLGSRRVVSAVPALTRLASDTDATTALAAIRALTSIGGAAADAALKTATGASPAARAAARLKVIPGLSDEAALASLAEIERDTTLPAASRRAAFRQQLDRDATASLPRLKEALQGSDWDRKEVALEAISTSPSPERINLLVAGLNSWDAPTQVAVIGILARTGAVSAVPAVSAAARGASPEIREAALEALGSLPGSKDTTSLLLGAATGTEDAAKAARRSLARLKGPGVSEAILAAAEKGDNASRASALESIAARNLTEGIPLLLRAREASETAIRNAALSALAEIGPYSSQAAVIAWAVAASDDTERTRALRAVVAVTQRGTDAAARAKPLFAAIESAPTEPAERLLGALPRLG
ncbi:MAG: HEAT repeat domain-containing protein, partial [Opitutaceae bacterium]